MTVQGSASTKRRRWPARSAAALVLAVAVWLAVCWAVLEHPRTDEPAMSDALLVLGPPDTQRMATAQGLMERGIAPVLVIATPDAQPYDPPALVQYYEDKDFCTPRTDYEVICFQPNPSTTQGEAMRLRDLAAERGWDTVTAVTFKQHVPRARMILERCYHGELRMSATDYEFAPLRTLRQYVYQSGGYVKAWLTPGCEQQLPGNPKELD
ncbi:YdcF family protein [Kocuria carniphila]|uniref:YdcF family protein n=1 Tax=Kocuria carniphila TaxID=262208 RepID=A0ABV3V118_9MICC